nr:unnamed protein product [Spirometra erinaceieuropaei]
MRQDGLVNYPNSEDSDTEQEDDQDAGTTSSFFFSRSPATDSLTPPDPPSPTDFWRTTVSDREPVCVQEPADTLYASPAIARPPSPPWQPPEITKPRAPDAGIEMNACAYRHLEKKKRRRLDSAISAKPGAEQKSEPPLANVPQKVVASEEFASEEAEQDDNLFKRLSFSCEDLPSGSWNTDDFYPRCSVCWPLLAVSCPVGKLSGILQFGVQVWKLDGEPLTAHRVATYGDAGTAPPGRIVWLRLLTKHWLAVAYETGFLCVWDNVKGQQVLRINVSGCCGSRLRAVSAALSDTDITQSCFLVAGDAPSISLWDLRIGDADATHRPAQRFNYQGYPVSTSDLLWLAHSGHFASCTDTVQRDVTDKSVAVWDLRLQSIISRQLYQERWGCSRMALARTGSHSCRFAVQTQGGGIIEVVGGRDTKRQYRMRRNLTTDDPRVASSSSLPFADPPLAPISYRLERRWRYEEHETQARPLGLAYSPDNRLLASGCWGSDGPVVYRSPWRKGPHSVEGEEAAAACLRLGKAIRGVLISDVAWLPIGTLEVDGQALVAVKNNCDLGIYRISQPM